DGPKSKCFVSLIILVVTVLSAGTMMVINLCIMSYFVQILIKNGFRSFIALIWGQADVEFIESAVATHIYVGRLLEMVAFVSVDVAFTIYEGDTKRSLEILAYFASFEIIFYTMEPFCRALAAILSSKAGSLSLTTRIAIIAALVLLS